MSFFYLKTADVSALGLTFLYGDYGEGLSRATPWVGLCPPPHTQPLPAHLHTGRALVHCVSSVRVGGASAIPVLRRPKAASLSLVPEGPMQMGWKIWSEGRDAIILAQVLESMTTEETFSGRF